MKLIKNLTKATDTQFLHYVLQIKCIRQQDILKDLTVFYQRQQRMGMEVQMRLYHSRVSSERSSSRHVKTCRVQKKEEKFVMVFFFLF